MASLICWGINPTDLRWSVIFQNLGIGVIAGPVCLVLALRMDRQTWRGFGWTGRRIGTDVVGG